MKLVILLLVTVALAIADDSKYAVTGDDGTEEIVNEIENGVEGRVSASDITLHFYSRNNPDVPEDYPLDVQRVISSRRFNPSKLNVFSIHGWTNDHYASMNIRVRDASLQAEDVNLFVVDWSGPAGGLYTSSAGNVRGVGQLLGNFILQLQSTLGLGADKFKLVGYSLGAHVAGNAGRQANGNVATIIGLDPAGPLFYLTYSSRRLAPSDAQFVQVIHTNEGTLGHSNDLGHVDIRPNGGSSQPGCGVDLAGSCAHSRAYQYYAESILSGGFTATKCSSYRDYSRGNCNGNEKTRLGGIPVDRSASGAFYLDTNSASPFSLG